MKETYRLQLENSNSLAFVDLMISKVVKEAVITRINVPRGHQGKGYGSKLLREVLKDADEGGYTLYLAVVPSDGMKLGQLIDWYRRIGFEDLEEEVLLRRPKSS